MRPKLAEIRALGAEMIAVGSGTAQHAAWFVKDQSTDFPVLTDPTHKVYDNAELHRGLLGLVDPRAVINTVQALFKGFRQAGRTRGDALQLGGVLIVLPGGKLAWRYSSDVAGDHPKPERIVEELEKAIGLSRAAAAP